MSRLYCKIFSYGNNYKFANVYRSNPVTHVFSFIRKKEARDHGRVCRVPVPQHPQGDPGRRLPGRGASRGLQLQVDRPHRAGVPAGARQDGRQLLHAGPRGAEDLVAPAVHPGVRVPAQRQLLPHQPPEEEVVHRQPRRPARGGEVRGAVQAVRPGSGR